MKKILANVVVLSLLAGFFVVPVLANAQSFNFMVCDGVETECDFNKLMELVGVIVEALITIATLFAVIAMIWVGFLLITSGGNEKAKTEAKRIGLSVLKGYLWILFAWLVVYTIYSTLLNPEYNEAFR